MPASAETDAPVHAVRVGSCEARDEVGKATGVRIIGAETKVFDYCATDHGE